MRKIVASAVEIFFILLNALPLVFGVCGAVVGFGFAIFVILMALNPLGLAFMTDSGSEGISAILSQAIYTMVLPCLAIGLVNMILAYATWKSIKTFLNKTYQWHWIVCVALLFPACIYSLQFFPESFSSNVDSTSPVGGVGTYVSALIGLLIITAPQILYIQKKSRLLRNSQTSLINSSMQK